MSNELHLLKALSKYKNFKKYSHLAKSRIIEPTTAQLLEWFDIYFQAKEDDVELDNLLEYIVHVQGLRIKDKDLALYKTIVSSVISLEDEDRVEEIVEAYEETIKLQEAVDLINKRIEGEEVDPEEYFELLKHSQPKSKGELMSNDIDFILTDEGGELEFKIEPLKSRVGRFPMDSFISIAAVPDGGKTSMVVNETLYMLAQPACVGGNLLFVNNEESGRRILSRYLANGLDMPVPKLRELLSSSEEAKDMILSEFKNLTKVDFSQIKLFEEDNTVSAIEEKIEELQPKIIVFNNLDKVQGMKGDDWKQIANLYEWARSLSKKYKCVVFGVGQAAATGTNAKFLGLSDLAQSKTAKAGEVDIIVALGRLDEDSPVCIDGKWYQIRYLNTPKNKISGERVKATLLLDPKTGIFNHYVEELGS